MLWLLESDAVKSNDGAELHQEKMLIMKAKCLELREWRIPHQSLQNNYQGRRKDRNLLYYRM